MLLGFFSTPISAAPSCLSPTAALSCSRPPFPHLCPSAAKVDCPEVDAHLFEFDMRFEQLDKFCFYDYNHPDDLPDYLHHAFDVRHCSPAQQCSQRCQGSGGSLTRRRSFAMMCDSYPRGLFAGCGRRPAILGCGVSREDSKVRRRLNDGHATR